MTLGLKVVSDYRQHYGCKFSQGLSLRSQSISTVNSLLRDFSLTKNNKAIFKKNLDLYSLVLTSRPEWNQTEYASITRPFPQKSWREGKVNYCANDVSKQLFAWLTNNSYKKKKISHAIHANLSQCKFSCTYYMRTQRHQSCLDSLQLINLPCSVSRSSDESETKGPKVIETETALGGFPASQ